jgi:protein MpaA
MQVSVPPRRHPLSQSRVILGRTIENLELELFVFLTDSSALLTKGGQVQAGLEARSVDIGNTPSVEGGASTPLFGPGLRGFSALRDEKTILVLGGVHGNEIEGVWLADAFIDWLRERVPVSQAPLLLNILVWPRVNPWGVAHGERCNGRSVDLNRNLATEDWTAEIKNPRYPPGTFAGSEPENQLLMALIEAVKPCAVLSGHSFSQYQVNSNGPAKPWAEFLSSLCGYPVTEDIGYPTPGSLGTYAGKERQIPTITLEIERGMSQQAVLDLHLPLLIRSLDYWAGAGEK